MTNTDAVQLFMQSYYFNFGLEVRQCRAGRLSKIEHSRRPGMRSKIARNEARSRDAGIVKLAKNQVDVG